MPIDVTMLAALIGLTGTAIAELLRYLIGKSKQEGDRDTSLEENQRQLLEILQTELRKTRADLTDAHRQLDACKREVIALLETMADRLTESVDSITENRGNGD